MIKEIELSKEKWETWLKAKGLSPRTIQDYNEYFDKFNVMFLSQSYLNEFVQRHNNPVARAMLKHVFHYIRTNEFPSEIKELAKEIEIPTITGRKKRKLPNVLSENQVLLVSNAMENERNKIMVLMTFYCGLRMNELLTILPYSFQWKKWLEKPTDSGTLKVVGKGNKQRQVFVPAQLMARVYAWIKNEVAPKGQAQDEPLFQIKKSRWNTLLNFAGVRALGRNINPHLLRHSCGTWLREQGWDLKEIAEFLGHESINTTQIYTHISQEQIKKKYEKLTNGTKEMPKV
jgi:integrase/recombinase XerD